MLQRIDMVVMYVRDWASAVDWYVETFDLERVFVEDDHRFAVLGLPGGGPVLHIVGDESRDASRRNRCVPNVSVADFDGTLAELARRGVVPLEVEDDPDDGFRLARFADPEGNEVNLYTTS
jgi:catechol 2,3-dioxygenase-like lactoylglutathione lyase family enzyme